MVKGQHCMTPVSIRPPKREAFFCVFLCTGGAIEQICTVFFFPKDCNYRQSWPVWEISWYLVYFVDVNGVKMCQKAVYAWWQETNLTQIVFLFAGLRPNHKEIINEKRKNTTYSIDVYKNSCDNDLSLFVKPISLWFLF